MANAGGRDINDLKKLGHEIMAISSEVENFLVAVNLFYGTLVSGGLMEEAKTYLFQPGNQFFQ